MKILKFNKSLLEIMGNDARKNPLNLGLKYTDGHQSLEKGFTLMKVIDEEKANIYINHRDVDVLTQSEANDIITQIINKVEYNKYDDALYGANINKLIQDGTLELNDLLPEWTEQQELEFLYSKNVSGIEKKNKIVEIF